MSSDKEKGNEEERAEKGERKTLKDLVERFRAVISEEERERIRDYLGKIERFPVEISDALREEARALAERDNRLKAFIPEELREEWQNFVERDSQARAERMERIERDVRDVIAGVRAIVGILQKVLKQGRDRASTILILTVIGWGILIILTVIGWAIAIISIVVQVFT